MQTSRRVVAFVALGEGTAYLPPVTLVTYNEIEDSWLQLAKPESVEAVMPAIR